MKIRILEKGPMILTGSKVLKAIMDNYTPPIDLFVRESIQNSADQIMEDKAFGRIQYNIGDFSNASLTSCLESISGKINSLFKEKTYKFISISDSNTYGLLGDPYKNENGGPNNLFNLVYDFMSNNEDENAGGSWGIGKSVYYRYGNGLCFYYSRTFENGKYISKLAGALIQNEKDAANCFLGNKSSGVAYFGDLDSKNNSIPIYNEVLIKEFLDIFGLLPYSGDKTGTIVIIPYLDVNLLLENNKNFDDDTSRYWLNDIDECLSMAIQRWYFSRINNESFQGKYLRIAINGSKVELCDFYKTLQDLYNGTVNGCKSVKITGKKFAETDILGTFNYKVFTKEELGVHTPPTNYPSPKYFVDSNLDVDRNGLLFYLRKPGMVLNYDNKEFGQYDLEEEHYLIGVFILNDDLQVGSKELLGKYMRKTEKSNHYEWKNDAFPNEYPILSKRKPFYRICATIRNLLNDEFKKNKAVFLDGSATIFQKKYGEKLMPPLDFGDKPSVPPKKPGGSGGGSSGGGGGGKTPHPKPKKTEISFEGLNSNGYLCYEVLFVLPVENVLNFKVDLKAGSKTFSFIEWEQMDFKFPCEIKKIEVIEFYLDNNKKTIPQVIPIDKDFYRKRKQVLEGVTIYKFKGLWTDKSVPYGFIVENSTEQKLGMRMRIEIDALDNKYSIGFNADIGKETKDEQ